MGRLASGIAHEIDTQVQFIGDNTRFLGEALDALREMLSRLREALERSGLPAADREQLDRLGEELDLPCVLERARPTVERTLEGVQRVASIVRAMKEFAHPDQMEMAATDLNRALRATLEVARNEYKYVADVETDLGEIPPVVCHAADVSQVFQNVIVNAAHAIGEAVKGTERRGLIRVATRLEGGAVTVSVSDTGTGVPEAARERLFDPFFTTKEVGKGTGPGLAIARSVVEKHKGSIRLDTELGQGTTFHIRLPLDGGRGAVRAGGTE